MKAFHQGGLCDTITTFLAVVTTPPPGAAASTVPVALPADTGHPAPGEGRTIAEPGGPRGSALLRPATLAATNAPVMGQVPHS